MGHVGLTVSGILIRFILGGGAVAASYVLARRLGGRWGGIFAAFPAVYIAAIVAVAVGISAKEGLPLTLQVSRGALVGMVSNIVCAIAAYLIIRQQGWKKGLTFALAIWVVCVAIIYSVITKTGLIG
ncbi:MAG: DUF3147 family protein [Firmicutes bacterium]|nr:DUF3147 family protein [Bacillota bacterium]